MISILHRLKSCVWPIRSGYDVIRISCAIVLFVAAGLKTYELSTSPTLGNNFLEARWFLFIAVEFEYFFALWLLPGFYPKQTWLVALLCFSLFFCVSLYKALSGYASCGCFGPIKVNPWYTTILDLAIVVSLLCLRPKGQDSLFDVNLKHFTIQVARVLVAWFFIAMPAGYSMGSYTDTTLSEVGEIIGNGNIVVLEPEKWIDKRFPLLDYIDTSNQLREGRWLVLLYHHDCPICNQIIHGLQHITGRLDFRQVALIELPPYGHNNKKFDLTKIALIHRRLPDTREWFVESPVGIVLKHGVAIDFLPKNALLKNM